MQVKTRLILTVILFMLCFTMTSEASQWDCGTTLDPYEVRIFQFPEFAGECKTFKLDPDARLRRVPKIEWTSGIGSIRVGSKVEVLLFEAPHFSRIVASGFSKQDSSHTIPNLFLYSHKLDFQPWVFRVSESLKVIGVPYPGHPQSTWPVSTFSFIIIHGNSQIQGVTTLTEYSFGPPALDGSKSFKAKLNFFPLSEDKKLNIAKYPSFVGNSFGPGIPFLPGFKGFLSHPLIRIDEGIRCEIFQNQKFGEKSIVLPPPGSKKDHFTIDKYNFIMPMIGSMKVVQTAVEASTGMAGTVNGQVKKTKPAVVGTIVPGLNDKIPGVLKDQKTSPAVRMPVHLKTHKGFYLVAEKGGGGAVNANRKKAREWETFTLIDLNGGPLYPGDKIHLKTYNGKHYVVAEGGGGGVVRADSTIPQELETFVIDEYFPPGSYRTLMLRPITDGEKITLKTHNGQYMVAENGGGGIVNANRSKVGDWEKFVLMKSVTPGAGGTNAGQDIKKPYSATGTMIPIPGGSVAGSPLETPRPATGTVTMDPSGQKAGSPLEIPRPPTGGEIFISNDIKMQIAAEAAKVQKIVPLSTVQMEQHRKLFRTWVSGSINLNEAIKKVSKRFNRTTYMQEVTSEKLRLPTERLKLIPIKDISPMSQQSGTMDTPFSIQGKISQKNEPMIFYTPELQIQNVKTVTLGRPIKILYREGPMYFKFHKLKESKVKEPLQKSEAIQISKAFLLKNTFLKETLKDKIGKVYVANRRINEGGAEGKEVADYVVQQDVTFERMYEGKPVINSKIVIGLNPDTREIILFKHFNWVPLEEQREKQMSSQEMQLFSSTHGNSNSSESRNTISSRLKQKIIKYGGNFTLATVKQVIPAWFQTKHGLIPVLVPEYEIEYPDKKGILSYRGMGIINLSGNDEIFFEGRKNKKDNQKAPNVIQPTKIIN